MVENLSLQKTNPALAKILESLEQGVAVFNKDRRLVYINSAMNSVTGGKGDMGGSLNDLAAPHRLRDGNGKSIPSV